MTSKPSKPSKPSKEAWQKLHYDKLFYLYSFKAGIMLSSCIFTELLQQQSLTLTFSVPIKPVQTLRTIKCFVDFKCNSLFLVGRFWQLGSFIEHVLSELSLSKTCYVTFEGVSCTDEYCSLILIYIPKEVLQ